MALRIFGLALSVLGRRLGTIAGAIAIPAAVLVAVNTLGPWAAGSVPGTILLVVVTLASYSWFAISIHRIVLLDEGFVLRWGWRETRFARFLILFSFGMYILTWFVIAGFESIGVPSIGIVAGIFQFGVYLGATYWVSQYFLIFPAIAVDHKFSNFHSAVASEDNRLTVFAVIAVFPVLLSIVEFSAALIASPMLSSFVGSLLSLVSITIGVAMLSILYRELVPDGIK